MADDRSRPARRSPPRSGAALAAGFVLLGAVLMASVLVSTRRQGDDATLRRALEVEVDLGNLRSAQLDAEVGQRGYLLTGDADFLTPYRAASDRLGAALARLVAPTRTSPDQAALLDQIRGLAEGKQAEMARTLALRDAGKVDGAHGLVRDKTGDGSAAAALRSADDLGAALAGLKQNGEALRFGVGLHRGEAYCGIVGGAERREFTVLGDVVDVASRIEAANKAFGTELLVSEAVLVAAEADRAGWREVSREPLRGHRGTVALLARWDDGSVR